MNTVFCLLKKVSFLCVAAGAFIFVPMQAMEPETTKQSKEPIPMIKIMGKEEGPLVKVVGTKEEELNEGERNDEFQVSQELAELTEPVKGLLLAMAELNQPLDETIPFEGISSKELQEFFTFLLENYVELQDDDKQAITVRKQKTLEGFYGDLPSKESEIIKEVKLKKLEKGLSSLGPVKLVFMVNCADRVKIDHTIFLTFLNVLCGRLFAGTPLAEWRIEVLSMEELIPSEAMFTAYDSSYVAAFSQLNEEIRKRIMGYFPCTDRIENIFRTIIMDKYKSERKKTVACFTDSTPSTENDYEFSTCLAFMPGTKKIIIQNGRRNRLDDKHYNKIQMQSDLMLFDLESNKSESAFFGYKSKFGQNLREKDSKVNSVCFDSDLDMFFSYESAGRTANKFTRRGNRMGIETAFGLGNVDNQIHCLKYISSKDLILCAYTQKNLTGVSDIFNRINALKVATFKASREQQGWYDLKDEQTICRKTELQVKSVALNADGLSIAFLATWKDARNGDGALLEVGKLGTDEDKWLAFGSENGLGTEPHFLLFTHDGKSIFVLDKFSSTILVWDIERRKVVQRFEGLRYNYSAILSADGNQLVLGGIAWPDAGFGGLLSAKSHEFKNLMSWQLFTDSERTEIDKIKDKTDYYQQLYVYHLLENFEKTKKPRLLDKNESTLAAPVQDFLKELGVVGQPGAISPGVRQWLWKKRYGLGAAAVLGSAAAYGVYKYYTSQQK